MSTNIPKCPEMSTDISKYPRISTDIPKCRKMSSNVNRYPKMSLDKFWHLLTVCRHSGIFLRDMRTFFVSLSLFTWESLELLTWNLSLPEPVPPPVKLFASMVVTAVILSYTESYLKTTVKPLTWALRFIIRRISLAERELFCRNATPTLLWNKLTCNWDRAASRDQVW